MCGYDTNLTPEIVFFFPVYVFFCKYHEVFTAIFDRLYSIAICTCKKKGNSKHIISSTYLYGLTFGRYKIENKNISGLYIWMFLYMYVRTYVDRLSTIKKNYILVYIRILLRNFSHGFTCDYISVS